MIYKANMKDVQNCSIIQNNGAYREKLMKMPDGTYQKSFTSSEWVCGKCGDYITRDNESEHKACLTVYLSEYQAAQELITMLEDDEDNVVVINEGLEDQCYLTLE